MNNLKLFSVILSSFFFLISCGNKAKKQNTTPQKEQVTPTDVADTEPTDKPVPADYEDKVDNIWQSGLAVVVDCVQQRVDQTKQKGVRGYVVISAVIGVKPNPQNVKVSDKKLPVDKIEDCIVKNIGELTFPTWGYPVKTSYSYSIDVSY